MKKNEFIDELRSSLKGLPEQEINDRIAFYSEMIDDRMEDGKSEDEAVSEIGTVKEVSDEIIASVPITKIVKERIKPKRRLRAFEIVLIILGFPIWFSLLVVALALIFTLYVCLWAVIVSLWAVDLSFALSFFACLIASGYELIHADLAFALVLVGTGLILCALAVLLFYVCINASKLALKLAKRLGIGIKSIFIIKGDN